MKLIEEEKNNFFLIKKNNIEPKTIQNKISDILSDLNDDNKKEENIQIPRSSKTILEELKSKLKNLSSD